ncbi:hypothetical protein FQA39_LY04500 [Lamprigera yunnana]|nr:hypothetical protein FQA39_LY04500 [Lamprigera yunnana]
MFDDLFDEDDEYYNLLLQDSCSSTSSDSSLDSFSDREDATRIENYINVVHEYSQKEFVNHFRLTKATVNYLIECTFHYLFHRNFEYPHDQF